MKEIPVEYKQVEDKFYCPVCGGELTECHDHWYEDLPGALFDMRPPSDKYHRSEVSQDPDGEWWLFKWWDDYGNWHLDTPQPVTPEEAKQFVYEHVDRLRRAAEDLQEEASSIEIRAATAGL